MLSVSDELLSNKNDQTVILCLFTRPLIKMTTFRKHILKNTILFISAEMLNQSPFIFFFLKGGVSSVFLKKKLELLKWQTAKKIMAVFYLEVVKKVQIH